MTGCLSQRDMAALLEGTAAPEQLTFWRRHLRLCDSCATELARLRAGTQEAAEKSEADTDEPSPSSSTRLVVGLEPNLQLGDFRLERRLGSGGMGVVYQAVQTSLNRHVALKVLPSGLGRNGSSVERFHREARAAARLRHRNIVTVYAEGIENTICYYAMELIEGRPLDQIILEMRAAKRGTTVGAMDFSGLVGQQRMPDGFEEVLPPEPDESALAAVPDIPNVLAEAEPGRPYFDTVARLIAEVAEALQYAHERGVIHRDVKPSNLMLARDGRLVLLDFGIARICQDRGMTMTGSFVGTPRYMSPEQVTGECHGVGSEGDIYSLGATLYELLTLEPLFDGMTREQVIMQILNKEPTRPRHLDRRIATDLETICRKAIEKEPGKRYASAGDLAEDLRNYLAGRVIKARPPGVTDRVVKLVRRRKVAAVLTSGIVLAMAFAGAVAWEHYTTRWAQQDAMVMIDELIEARQFYEALEVAQRAAKHVPDDPLLELRWPTFSREYVVNTVPSDADIYIGPYSATDTGWTYLGRSPLRGVRVPFGPSRWRAEKAGFVPVETVRTNELSGAYAASGRPMGGALTLKLEPVGVCPEDMAFVGASVLDQRMLFHGERVIPSAPPFLIDKYEVTNSQFREFVKSGGYERQEFWEQEFVENGQVIPWAGAMKRFRDSTGQPGPATWKNGSYGRNEGDLPVGGISWYEAAAYARFREKDLPTIFHWTLAARADDMPSRITRLSNFDEGPAPVGQFRGMGQYGLYDAAGNMREWCFNGIEGEPETRCSLGGAWGEPDYAFVNGSIRSSWDRDPANGFRCVRYLPNRDDVPVLAFAPVEHRSRDFSQFAPVSDVVFRSYLDTWYRYDPTPLNSGTESEDHEMGYCKRERISFDAAYPNERITAYIYLPRYVDPPFQVVIWHPSADAQTSPWDDRAYSDEIACMIQSGRAVIIPFYKGTYERRLEQTSYASDSTLSRNLCIQRTQDLRRTVDYLVTRGDIDSDKIAFAGMSWGGQMGPIMIACESRIKTGILLLGGICACPRHPIADPANFAPHVTVPILMINSRGDSIFPYETAQKPLFDLLGTPEADKRHLLFPGGHSIPWEYRQEYFGQIVAWLNEYLGPTELSESSE